MTIEVWMQHNTCGCYGGCRTLLAVLALQKDIGPGGKIYCANAPGSDEL
ncbi:hypothetical protein AWB81_07918 [Caballeronia arationis]|nr:hypothetical protein AWB81_07918 [Caballeronia arationis]